VRAEHEIQLLPPALNQLALVQLMQSGAYDRHLRSSRQRYRSRRNALVDALRRHLPGYRVRGEEAGLQLLLELRPGTDLPAILRAAARRGIELCNLYEMQLQPEPADPALLVGYGNIKDTAIDGAVAALAEVIRDAGGDEFRRPGASNGYERTEDLHPPGRRVRLDRRTGRVRGDAAHGPGGLIVRILHLLVT
jgi:DNA-binding transcriptional MocR family regulator